MKTITCIFLFCILYCITSAQNTNISGIVNVYRKVIAADSAKGLVKLSDASNLIQYIGNNVIIIQMKGAAINSTNSPSFGDITDIGSAGRFEIAKICGQLSDTIVFENKLQNFYDPAGLIQMVVIPRYVNATVTDTLKPRSWDPVAGVGGVLAIEAMGTLFLNASVYADSSGFRGGGLINNTSSCSNTFPSGAFYYNSGSDVFGRNGAKKGEGISEYIPVREYGKGKQANGGGGGNNSNHGGGGGGNAGVGGVGGIQTSGTCSSSHGGIGGQYLNADGYSSANFRTFMGGGGGAGHENNSVGTPGGSGGGIVFIKASTITSAGNKITSNGGVPYNPANVPFPYKADSDGGGGGGAGGVVILESNTITGTLNVEAKGGRGSDTEYGGTTFCAGPGGGGGGGAIWYSSASIPGNVFTDVTGGTNGLVMTTCILSNNNAAPGSIGVVKTGFAFPAMKDSSPVCKTILAVGSSIELMAHSATNKILFTASLNAHFNVSKIFLQRSFDGIAFTTIDERASVQSVYAFEKPHEFRNCFYRVSVVTLDGRKMVSNVLLIRGRKESIAVQIFPNPVINILQLLISSERSGKYPYAIVDLIGRKINEGFLNVEAVPDTKKIFLPALQKGIYFFRLNGVVLKFWKE